MKKLLFGGVVLLIFLAAQLAHTGGDGEATRQCVDPRPQICTQEYNPVCATLQDGSTMTYASGCTACSDVKVVAHTPGKCG